jgi:hypothetical protein
MRQESTLVTDFGAWKTMFGHRRWLVDYLAAFAYPLANIALDKEVIVLRSVSEWRTVKLFSVRAEIIIAPLH